MSRPEDRARHLDRAAEYLFDDASVTRDAAETLARLGEELVAESRVADALRLLDRAVALGSRRPSTLLELSRLHELVGNHDSAAQTLALVEDDPDDPSVAVQRDHAIARARIFSDPTWARPRLETVSTRWQSLGDERQAAWAIANAGVASFNLSRMEEAAADLGRAWAIFERVQDRAGAVAASSFLCLITPTDPRVPGWLADALEFADQAGDRTKLVAALSPLAWHHFLLSMWGGPADTAAAERFAFQLAEVAEDLGAIDGAVHGRSLLAIIARFQGRIRVAATHAGVLARHLRPENHEPWLGWAASFAVAVAEGASTAAAPFPPRWSTDPVVGVAELVVQAELVFAGRSDEALSHFRGLEPRDTGSISQAMGLLCSLGLVVSGRRSEAAPWAERALVAARRLEARPAQIAATALLAEINGRDSELPDPPAVASSVAESLVLRAHVALGREAARPALQRAADVLVAPGLLFGL